jgi:hypothetical protein
MWTFLLLQVSYLQYTHDGASAKFSTNSHETDNSVEGHAFLFCDGSLEGRPVLDALAGVAQLRATVRMASRAITLGYP